MILRDSISEAEILTELFANSAESFSTEAAKAIVNLKLSQKSQSTIQGFLTKNNAGTLSKDEEASLENYLRVGLTPDLMQSICRYRIQIQSNP